MTIGRNLRFGLWCVFAPALLVGQLAWLWALRGPALLDADAALMGGQLALGACVLGLAGLLATTPADAIKLRRRASVAIVLGGAIALQAAAVAWPMPVLSDDWARYRTDGLTWLLGATPYAVPPADERVQAGGDAVDRLVSYAEVRTIYPPVAQAIFVAARAVERATVGPPVVASAGRGGDAPAAPGVRRFSPDTAGGDVNRSAYRAAVAEGRTTYAATAWKLAAALAAVAATGALLAALADGAASPWWAVLFAWNPLVVLESGGMAHVDPAGAALLVVALWLAARRPLVAAAALALACGVKPVAVVVAPFLLRDAGPAWPRATGVLGVTLAVTFGPALLVQDGHAGWRQTGARFAREWEANGSAYELAKRTLAHVLPPRARQGTKDWSRRIGLIIVAVAGVVLWRRRAGAVTAAYVLLVVMLLVAPVAYPWYLVWPLAVVPLLGGRAGWAALVWSATAALSYRLWREPAWVLPAVWVAGQYVTVYAAGFAEWYGRAGWRREDRSP